MANLVTYAKQKWEDAKTAITAARLNNMEQGINDCATQINALGDSVCQRQIVANSNEWPKKQRVQRQRMASRRVLPHCIVSIAI